jgi:sensor histidine kinase YesM
LQGELDHIRNILKMHEYRTKEKICVEFKSEGDIGNASIVPLTIIPFIENAIKYAELNDPENPLQIEIAVKEKEFIFYNRNKVKGAKQVLEEGSTSHGIGLSNTRQRLVASYHTDGYELKLEPTGDYFSVTIRILDLNKKPKMVVENIF